MPWSIYFIRDCKISELFIAFATLVNSNFLKGERMLGFTSHYISALYL